MVHGGFIFFDGTRFPFKDLLSRSEVSGILNPECMIGIGEGDWWDHDDDSQLRYNSREARESV